MRYSYTTSGVCSRQIDFDLEDGTVRNVSFTSGCPGNLKAISKLVEGMPAQDVIDKLKGNTCAQRPTSCADQLSCALEAALQQEAG